MSLYHLNISIIRPSFTLKNLTNRAAFLQNTCMKQVSALLALARWREYYGIVIFLSLLGVLFAGDISVITVVDVLLANILSAAFAFMINDVEDWKDDIQDPKKKNRNPISAGRISVRLGTLVSYVVAAMSLGLYAVSGMTSFWLGSLGLLLGYLYSLKLVRLKSIPVLDVLSHGFFLGVVYFITMALADGYVGSMASVAVLAILIFSISVLGDLVNEVRDFVVDKKTGITNTVQLLRLEKIGKYISPVTTLLSVVMFSYVFLQLPLFGKALIFAYGSCFAAHYLWYKYTHKSDVYSYPFVQQGLAGLGMAIVMAGKV